jgi:ketopantoate reductase
MAKIAVVGCGKGAIARLGKPLGVATPVDDTLVGIIKARERGMLG